MPTITLKNVPEELHRRLKARAARNHRSLNREAIRCLEQAVTEEDPAKDAALLARIQERRSALAEAGFWLTDDAVTEAKSADRP